MSQKYLPELILLGGMACTSVIAIIVMCFYGIYYFSGPLVGAMIATGTTISFNRYFNEKEKRVNIRLLVDVLIAELTVLDEVIKDRKKQFVQQMEMAGESLYYFNIVEDYFTIFSQNAGKLGLLSPALSAEVIRVYIETKGLFDSIRAFSDQTKELILTGQRLFQMNASGMGATKEYAGIHTKYEQQLAQHKINSHSLSNEYTPKILNAIECLIVKLNNVNE